MNTFEEKVVMENSLDQMRREVRIMTQNLDDKKRELATIIEFRKQNEERLEATNQQLTAIVNRISEERLAWAQEKAEEQKKLEDRNAEIDRIVAIESELRKRHSELNQKEIDLQELLKKDADALLEIERAKIDLDMREKALEERHAVLAADRVTFKNEVLATKKQLLDVIKKIEKI